MEVTLLGTGDTTGTPTPGCDCETCTTALERGIERTRFSVHVYNPASGESLLIDTSPDFRYQYLREGVPLPDEVIITHIHFDHLDGLGNIYRLTSDVPVYASTRYDELTDESAVETIKRKYGYLRSIEVKPIDPFESMTVCGLEVELFPVNHPPVESHGLRIRDPNTGGVLAITGDTNYAIPEESRVLLRDADLLLADALVHAGFCDGHPAGGTHEGPDGIPRTFGTKHMTREGALSLAEELDAGTVRLVHVSHFYPADEAFEEPLAVDGEHYEL